MDGVAEQLWDYQTCPSCVSISEPGHLTSKDKHAAGLQPGHSAENLRSLWYQA